MSKQDDITVGLARVADIALILGGLLALSAFAYAFYQYGWTGQRQFTSRAYVLVYYGLPLATAALLFAALRFPPAQRGNFLILLVTVVGCAWGAELFMEFGNASFNASAKPAMAALADARDKKAYAASLSKGNGGEIDTRTADQVIFEMRSQGIDAIPLVSPSNNIFLRQADGRINSVLSIDGREVMPLAGVASRVTLICNESGQWIHFESDAHGFNNPGEIWRNDHVEIAALGDSFVHGYCVPGESNFVALIRRQHPATINLGVAGDGPLLMLATLIERAAPFTPKTVLWFYYEGNDLTDLQTERKSAVLSDYLNDGFTQPDLERQDQIDRGLVAQIPRMRAVETENQARRQKNRLAGRLANIGKLSELRQLLHLVGGMEGGDRQVADDLRGPNMDVFREVLLQAKTRVGDWGGQLYFVYLPEWARYTTYDSWGKTERDAVLTMVRDLGIPVIDIDPVFRTHGDPLSLFPFRGVGHYNQAGHRLVAEGVLKALPPR